MTLIEKIQAVFPQTTEIPARFLAEKGKTSLGKQIITRIVRDHKSKFLATDLIL